MNKFTVFEKKLRSRANKLIKTLLAQINYDMKYLKKNCDPLEII